jgi:hypothetical protein
MASVGGVYARPARSVHHLEGYLTLSQCRCLICSFINDFGFGSMFFLCVFFLEKWRPVSLCLMSTAGVQQLGHHSAEQRHQGAKQASSAGIACSWRRSQLQLNATPLCLALDSAREDVVQVLLDARADANDAPEATTRAQRKHVETAIDCRLRDSAAWSDEAHRSINNHHSSSPGRHRSSG